MKTVFAFLFLTFSILRLAAQDATIKKLQDESNKAINKDPSDTSKKIWKAGGLYNLNIGQSSLSNWAAGGDDFSLTVNSFLNLFSFYKKGKNSWDNSLDIGLGYLKTTTLGSRKNDDRFNLLSKYGHALNPKLNLGALMNFRSQFFKGFAYTDTSKILSSNFLAPGYALISLGVDYKPSKNLSVFISPVTSRWVIVNNDSLARIGSYGVDSGKTYINQMGAFATINYVKEVNKHLTYRARLDLFSNYKKDPQNIDVYMTNILSAKLAKFLSVTWSVDMVYDNNAKLFGKEKNSAALQVKSIIGVGLMLKFPNHS